jgi:hypothetical protein
VRRQALVAGVVADHEQAAGDEAGGQAAGQLGPPAVEQDGAAATRVDKGSSHWRICLRCGMGAAAGMGRSVEGIDYRC